MRIYLNISKNTSIIPFNYQQLLTGVLHKWIGKNSIHDEISLYSFSWLKNGKASKEGIEFPSGSSFFISSYDNELLNKIIQGIQNSPELFKGMVVEGVKILENPVFSKEERFMVGSPVFIKRREDNNIIFFYYNDKDSGKFLTETLSEKLLAAGLDANNVSVEFDKTYKDPKIRHTSYCGISSKGSVCPVIIKGTPEQIAFAWNVGIGNSTGIGFGSLN